ncbi:T9SS type A sorting domain-containing protein [uncultured Kordia sp.]|uniref:T9SS type A sorting domain-containing protein n=1 Tax=uncultured Kordia sp. TaxID=507699 RepID=UPI002605742E|nr:T9SS type A sorting domain-containing protein [uncultured Kordia sp.]
MMKKLLDYWCKYLIAHPKEFVFLTLVLFSYGISNAQIVINEVKETGSIELKNLGASTVDVSTYWLCDFPAYERLDDASITVESGSLMLAAGAIVEISGFNFIDSTDGELGLYSSAAFSSSAAIVDYIEWGSTGHQRSSVAVAAGTWTTGNYIPAFDSSLSIQFDGDGNTAGDYGAYVSTLGAENGTCPEAPDGGMVTLADGTSTSYANCAGDIVFDVAHTTTATNISYWYIITDNNDNILAWQNSANGNTLDLSAAPAGECHVWGWSYSGLPNPVVGQNISTLSDDDCEDISDNWVTVYREVPDGGTVTLADGTSTSYANCVVDIVFDMAHTTTAPNLSYWYIITDNNDNILAWQNAANGNTLDLSAAPAGECHVWGWNYRGLPNPIVGDHISTLSDDDCEDISDNWVTVYRETPDGGTVTLADGTSTSYANCAGDIVFDMAHTTTAPNLSYWYIITDNNDNILAWQNAANGNTLDLSAAPAGECHVWGWNYRGLPNPTVGDHISTLADDDCEDISDNWVTVYRETPDGGTVTLADGTSTSYANCAGDIVFDVAHTTTAPNLSYWYIITDNNDNILAWQNAANGNTLDLSAAPAGECHVWGWNYRGLPNPTVGDHISTLADDDCEDISDNWVTVYREVPDGGTVTLADGTSTSYANCAGDIVFDVAHTTTATNISYWYIITDNNDNILAWQNSANGNTLDLSAAPAGECHVWGWNYRGLPNPTVGDHISTLADDDCEDISDNWVTVYREVPDGGTVTLADGTTTSYTGQAGNIVFDVAHTTTAPNLSYWYIITDDNDNILAWQNAANGNTLDLSAAPVGECHVWGWNYRGLPNPTVGDHISTLADDDCEDISDNWITVTREDPLSVEDFASRINFSAYPNPTNGVLNLQSSANQSFDITIELYDVSGRRVYQEENTLRSTVQINLSSLQSGMYLLNITDKESNSKITRRVIKQ